MNNIPFIEKSDFPLDSTVLNTMQGNYNQIADYFVKFLGASTAVISGVEKQPDNSYSPGVVIINGELLPFVESAGNYVEIIETEENVVTEYGEYTVLRKLHAQATTTNTTTTMSSLENNRFSYKSDLAKKANIAVPINKNMGMYVPDDNPYVAIIPGLMLVDVDALQNVTLRGRIIFKYPLEAGMWPPNSFITLFNINDNTVIVQVGKEKIIPVFPNINDFMDVYFTGYNEYNPEEMYHFRLRGDGDFQLFVTNSFIMFDKGVYINVMYANKLKREEI